MSGGAPVITVQQTDDFCEDLKETLQELPKKCALTGAQKTWKMVITDWTMS